MMVTDVFLARSLARFTVRWIRSYFVVGSYRGKGRTLCETNADPVTISASVQSGVITGSYHFELMLILSY